MGSGDKAYFGFEYQIQVSVLLMLRQHHAGNFVELQIETDFGHDASLISHTPSGDDNVEKEIGLTYHGKETAKHVQVKTKDRKYQWGASEFRDVLLKKDESKTSDDVVTVIEQLVGNSDDVFYFITDGTVTPALSPLLVGEFTIELSRHKLSEEELDVIKNTLINSSRSNLTIKSFLKSKLTVDVLSRVFIIQAHSMDVVKLLSREALSKAYGLPVHEVDSVLRVLVDKVRERVLRTDSLDRFSLQELEAITGKPGKNIPFSSLDEHFVETPAYREAVEILEDNYLVLLTGEPGVGKTAIGEALVNRYTKRHYQFQSARFEAALAVRRACVERQEAVFLLDDIFGDAAFDNTIGNFANQFNLVMQDLTNAQGRVKVILTSRRDVLNDTLQKSRLRNETIKNTTISVPYPSWQVKEQVLLAHLAHLSDERRNFIVDIVNPGHFEDLAHIRLFSQQASQGATVGYRELTDIVDLTRPSAYKEWVNRQPERNLLVLILLWSLIKTNQFANLKDLERLFSFAQLLATIKQEGLDSVFYLAYIDLHDYQGRIQTTQDKYVDFIHPRLYLAVGDYLQERQLSISKFLLGLTQVLSASNSALDQSVAAMLCCVFFDSLGKPSTVLQSLISSKYVQARETIFRFGGTELALSLTVTRSNNEELSNSAWTLLTRIDRCEVDENGDLVIRQKDALDDVEFTSAALIDWLDIKGKEIPAEVLQRFEWSLNNFSTSNLNALERIEFARWLYGNCTENLSSVDLLRFIFMLSVDPISFVRKASVPFLSKDLLLNYREAHEILYSLCMDGHPEVKIEVLEKMILRLWRFQSQYTQHLWIEMVVNMLEDPFFRERTANGLIDMSGSLHFYHANHTDEQKRSWFIAVLPALLGRELRAGDTFDRLLAKLDEYYLHLPLAIRVNFLSHLLDHSKKFQYDAADTAYFIVRLALEEDLERQEHDLLNQMLSVLPPEGRAKACFGFSRCYKQLQDERYRAFVRRAFFNELPEEYISERAATIVALIQNTDIDSSEVANILGIGTDNHKSITELLDDYLEEQAFTFKIGFILIAFTHGPFYNIANTKSEVIRHKSIKKVLSELASTTYSSDIGLVIVALLHEGYWIFKKEKEWREYINPFMYSLDDTTAKKICDFIFSSNVAQSVHRFNTFLDLVATMVDHPDEAVQRHIIDLIDKHADSVIEAIQEVGSRENWTDYAHNTWLSNSWVNSLLQRSTSLAMYWTLMKLIDSYEEYWDYFNDETKGELVNALVSLTNSGRVERVYLVEGFYRRFSSRLTSDQQILLRNAIYINEEGREDIRHRMNQLREDWKLRDLYPETEWNRFFQ